MSLGFCQRSHDVIEPMLLPQWWVNCEEMAKRSTDAVRKGELTIRPEQGRKTFFEYLDNIRPWCISRQLWWGHRIPAYLVKDKDGNCLGSADDMTGWVVGRNAEEAKANAAKKFPDADHATMILDQDEDVL